MIWHRHTWTKWSDPISPFSVSLTELLKSGQVFGLEGVSDTPIQVRVCTTCNKAQRRQVI